VILSTHILPEVLATCTDVTIIHRGDIVYAENIARIGARMDSGSLLLRTHSPADAAALAGLDGVESVEATADGGWRIAHAAGNAPTDSVAQLVMDRGWGLVELSPVRKTLEQVFVELTTADIGVTP
jgi:ABC-2 type transport system ATP-binding protein